MSILCKDIVLRLNSCRHNFMVYNCIQPVGGSVTHSITNWEKVEQRTQT